MAPVFDDMTASEDDVIHAHHPHVLGEAAVRVAGAFECPLVFTYHTMYEHHLHYVPAHNEAITLR